MSVKRRNTSSPELSDLPSPKRQNTRHVQDGYDGHDSHDGSDWDDQETPEAPRVGDSSGQLGAFPGLSQGGDELFYGPADNGIDFLRMVRSEAKSVPHILTAPAPPTHEALSNHREDSCAGEEGGYYYDGAYTAITHGSPVEADSLPSAQQSYYDSLLTQFRLVQATMRCTPPLSSIECLRSSQLISFPEVSRKARLLWGAHIMSSDPHPVQVACLDMETVLELVKLLRMKLSLFLLNQDRTIVARVGVWIWAVLGKCRDRGEMSSEDIGELRGLAQRAVRILEKLDREAQGERWSLDSEGEASNEDEAAQQSKGETDMGSRPPVAQLGDEGKQTGQDAAVREDADAVEEMDCPRLRRITLDMIITVVGEVYGQRDLLEQRQKWIES